MNKILPPLATLLAIAALWMAITSTRKTEPAQSNENSTAKQSELKTEVARLKSELQKISDSHASLEAKVMELKTRPAAIDPSAANTSELQQRLATLEAQQNELNKFTNDFDQYGVVSSMEAELVNAYTTLMDTNQSVGARLKMVGQLKRYQYFDDKALQVVSDIYLQTDDFNQKGQALASMKGLVTPEFRDQILTDLATEVEAGNKSGRFRYYAIEALEPMLPDPAVEEWLVHLSQNDPQPKLAGRAGQALGVAPAK
jgi:septal ring factor EnvC (AmiA/AmiB activator)